MINILKKSSVATLLLVSMALPPVPAAAQTQFQPQSIQELIAYLQGIIVTLEAQLRAQQGGGVSVGTALTGGVADTLAAQSVVRDGAYLRGQINLPQTGTVTVWFEYGRSIVNEFETPRQRYTNQRNFIHGYDLAALRSNTSYSYRLVAETGNGQRYYGQVRSFVTSGTSASGSTSQSDWSSSFGIRSSYNPGDTITVTVPNWSDVTADAWVGVYRLGTSDTSYLSWQYIYRTSQVYLEAPATPGQYEVRLFRDGGYDRRSTSHSFTVR